MSASVNLVILVGNLGEDPKIITGRDGKKIAQLSVATSESWRDKNSGDRKEVTDWHRVVVFSEPLVKFAEEYLKKGNKVYIKGKQKTRKWEKEGQAHYSTETVLSNFQSELQSLTPREGGRGAPSEDEYGTSKSTERPSAGPGNDMDDDIPF